jgi:hypothetical protein
VNAEIKQQWITALRSGEYKQGELRLKWTDKDGSSEYCCLGVLCDLYSKATNTPWTSDISGIPNPQCGPGRMLNEACELPVAVRTWSGIPSGNPRVLIGNESTSLMRCNDELYKSFSDIADLIEQAL